MALCTFSHMQNQSNFFFTALFCRTFWRQWQINIAIYFTEHFLPPTISPKCILKSSTWHGGTGDINDLQKVSESLFPWVTPVLCEQTANTKCELKCKSSMRLWIRPTVHKWQGLFQLKKKKKNANPYAYVKMYLPIPEPFSQQRVVYSSFF